VYSAIIENIMSNAKCNLLNMAVMRDTVVTVQGTQNKETRSAFCTNVAIPAADKQNWQVMRIVYDDTHGNTGNRGWNAHFYTKYGNTQTPILLKDIAEQDKVNLFGPDRWVVLPKHGQAVRGTYRTEADERAKDIKNYLWKDGAQQSDAKSMWNEPILVFRVDKVYDRGGNHSTNTWWNHQFKKFVLSKIHSDKSSEMFCQDWWKINSNTMYVENRLFMDGNPFQWENYSNDIFK
jgi:hypothetical protein